MCETRHLLKAHARASFIHMLSQAIRELPPPSADFKYTVQNCCSYFFRTYVPTIFLILPISTIHESIAEFRLGQAKARGAFEFVLSASCKNRTCSIFLFLCIYFCFIFLSFCFLQFLHRVDRRWRHQLRESSTKAHRERVSRRQIDTERHSREHT